MKEKSKAIIRELIAHGHRFTGYTIQEVKEALTDALESNKVGTWTYKHVDDTDVFMRNRWYCSACGEWNTYGTPKYCPKCGAEMEDAE